MSLLWGPLCIFVACSPIAAAPQVPNLVVTATPASALISVAGNMQVTALAEESATLESYAASSASFYAAPGSYYTVQIQAEAYTSFTRRVWVRDDRRIELNVGLARKGGSSGDAYTEAFEAETAAAGSSFDLAEDDLASAGGYLVQPESVANSDQGREDAFIAVSVPSAGRYTLWARMYAASDASDAVYLGFNGQLERTYPDVKGEYAWVRATDAQLEAGSNKIGIGHGEAGARLDLLVITSDALSTRDLGAYVTMVAVSETPIAPRRPADPGTPAPAPTPTAPNRPDTRAYALRGDPNFSVSQLSSEQRRWYDRVWAAIENPELQPNPTALAQGDNIYHYRGDLQDYVIAVLTAFRVTGDLRLLDEADRIAELMRSELRDEWRDTLDGTNGTKDGYLNWVERYTRDPKFTGKDTHEAFDMKANALVAMIAWALENNRDLRSPAGVDYGAHADFWKDYLVNDFEAKWRERKGIPSGFPFLTNVGFHTYHSWMRWNYYMGKLTGDGAYTKEAERMANVLWGNEFKEVTSKYGSALIWPRGVLSLGIKATEDLNYLMPQDYARYVLQEALDLYFEGFDRYADEATMRKIANAIAGFVIDDDSYQSFARDIGGGSAMAGISASNPRTWSRMNEGRFAISAWSYYAAWDSSPDERIAQASLKVFRDLEGGSTPTRIFIPVGMLLYEMLN